MKFLHDIVTNALRFPRLDDAKLGSGSQTARQMDVALMNVGFKLTREALVYLSTVDPTVSGPYTRKVLESVRTMLGDNQKHNTFFRNFPFNVPDTLEYWHQCWAGTKVYGSYGHTYEEMLEHQNKLVPAKKPRYKYLDVGGTYEEEREALFAMLVGSTVPLSGDRLALLTKLVEDCTTVPEMIPVRENRAVVNAVRIRRGLPLSVNTVTDVLRLAVHLSGGDVTLEKPSKFKSFSRSIRRQLMSTLNTLVVDNAWKVGDVATHREIWKRMGERLHPHEFTKFGEAQGLFAFARGESNVTTLSSKIELAFLEKDYGVLTDMLGKVPGFLFRNLDRLIASGCPMALVYNAIAGSVEKVSGRVLLSVREHFMNRVGVQSQKRIFTNRDGKSWVKDNDQDPIDESVVVGLLAYIDAEISRRLPALTNLTVDPGFLGTALPLSEKGKAKGFGVLPRGSRFLLTPGKNLRFFMHWCQTEHRTDYDLSVLQLDSEMDLVSQCSWTGLRGTGMVHSGDITNAPRPSGATEFIDVDLSLVPKNVAYLVPQVNVFTGENFEEAAEAYFGFMERTAEERGKPFEASTVVTKSDLSGSGKVALPLMFVRDGKGWAVKWLHMNLKGHGFGNRLEANRVSTGLLAKSVVDREYLTVGYLVDLLQKKAITVAEEGNTHIGYTTPVGGTKCYGPNNLIELIPE